MGILLVGLALVATVAMPARAQSPARVVVAAEVPVASSREFVTRDVGIGALASWRVHRVLAVDGDLAFYPSSFPDQPPAFSRRRIEWSAGVSAGPTLGAWRPFGTLRAGTLSYSHAAAPFACILIYPPPLTCALAAGATLPVVDVGGGIERHGPGRLFVRLDVTDRAVRYDGPVLTRRRRVEQTGFWSHAPRTAVAVGVAF